jgi:molecular chaperone DnaJ
LVKVHVGNHPLFSRRGDDLHITVPISYTEATLGTTLEVPTLNGKVSIKVPAGTPSGKTFRVKGRGVSGGRRPTGDLYAKVEVVVPAKISSQEKRLLEELAAIDDDDLRGYLRTRQETAP